MEQTEDQPNLNAARTTKTQNKKRPSRKRKLDKVQNENKRIKKHPASDYESSYSKFETINEDCLRHLFQYLNIMDVVNVAATCTRLQNYANSDFFPKKAKQIRIEKTGRKFTFVVPFDDNFTSKLSMKSLITAFRYFGEFVEDLSFNGYKLKYSWRCFEIVLEHCKQLKTIKFKFLDCETHVLKNVTESPDELELKNCSEHTNTSTVLKGSSKIEKFCCKPLSGHFFNHFKNLSSLTIRFAIYTDWEAKDLEQIFSNNVQCLKHLKLSHLDNVLDYESVGKMIAKKLPLLESLSLEFRLSDNSKPLLRLSRLTTLKIFCPYRSINYLMRALSYTGNIEELMISNGFFNADRENKNPRTLVFNKLRSFYWESPKSVSSFLKAMTRSQMPTIRSIVFYQIKTEELYDLLKFIDSKKTLKLIRLSLKEDKYIIPYTLLSKLIDILKEPCTPKRSFLNLYIYPLRLGEEERQLLSSNQHLINVKSVSEFFSGTSAYHKDDLDYIDDY